MEIKIKKFGTTLTSRQLGKEAFLAFAPTLKNISGKENLEIDFEGVNTLSPSWADEFLRPLTEKYKKRLVLKNTDNISVKTTLIFLKKATGLNLILSENLIR